VRPSLRNLQRLPAPQENARMATAKPSTKTTPPPPEHGVLAAVLSLLIPGLGQVLQCRIG
jgi:hypothetical protein